MQVLQEHSPATRAVAQEKRREPLNTLDEFRQFTAVVKVPVLANITEFGKTPLFTVSELASVRVGLVLHAFCCVSGNEQSR